jgi:hypothetical protein
MHPKRTNLKEGKIVVLTLDVLGTSLEKGVLVLN